MKLIIFSPLLLFYIFLSGCAHQKGTIGRYDHYPSINISTFHNDTFQPGLEEKLTNQLTEEFLADGRVSVENANKEINIAGRIKKYTRIILAVNGKDDVTLYQLSISVDLHVLDIYSVNTIAHYPNINVTTTYVPQRSNIEFETETDAQVRLLEDLAEEIVYQLLDKDKKILTYSNPD